MSRVVGRCKKSSLDRVMFWEGTGITDLKVTETETLLFKGLPSPA